jgi:polyisoprenoid-binding protein YceI
MTGKLLQVLGLCAVVGTAGAGAAALLLLKDRVRIVVQDGLPPAVDPAALLRDDLQATSRDLQALSQAVAENFGRLQQAVVGQREQVGQQASALQREVEGLRQAATDAGERLHALERTVQALLAKGGAGAAPAVDMRPAAPPVPAPGAAAATPAAAAPAAEAPAAAPTTGFLTFQLPSRRFRFDAEQDYEIVPDLSRVGFDAKSTLHDFSGVTSKVTGAFRANLADAQGRWTGSVACEAAALVTGVDGRDADMRTHLDVTAHPTIEFAIEGFAPAAGGVDAAREQVRGEVRGTMAIRGVRRELRMPVTVSVDPSRRVVVEGQAALRLPDYGVPVPSRLGVISMREEVVVWVALRARVRAEGRRGS